MHYLIPKLIFDWVISASFTSNIFQSSPGPLVVISKRFPPMTCITPLTYWIVRGCCSSLSGYNGLRYYEHTHLSKPPFSVNSNNWYEGCYQAKTASLKPENRRRDNFGYQVLKLKF